MTKEQFISGTPFYIGTPSSKGDSTYMFEQGSITRQIRSSIDRRIILDTYECNVAKIGRVGFTGFSFTLNKRTVVKLKFADLVEFKTEEA